MGHTQTVRVLAIPSGHRYVQQIRPSCCRFLPDPTDPWWPHPGLEPAHLRTISHEIDLVHLHFGFEHRTTPELVAWLDHLDDYELPLVVTVHDIRNPHLIDNTRHEEHLQALLARASVVLTLTACAAGVLKRRWGRTATVVAHPPLYQVAPGASTEPGLVGITFKDRPSAFGPELLEPIRTAARRRDSRVQVRFEPGTEPAGGLGALPLTDGIETVAVHHPPDDETFAAQVSQLQVAVLPYRFGTHSGWLEACRDLGTRVVAPSTGCYRDQWPDVLTFDPHPDRLARSLEQAADRALALGPIPPPTPSAQRHRLDAVRSAHGAAYRSALAESRP